MLFYKTITVSLRISYFSKLEIFVFRNPLFVFIVLDSTMILLVIFWLFNFPRPWVFAVRDILMPEDWFLLRWFLICTIVIWIRLILLTDSAKILFRPTFLLRIVKNAHTSNFLKIGCPWIFFFVTGEFLPSQLLH